MEVSRYHRFLRVSLLVMVCVLVFDSGIISPITKTLSDNTFMHLGSVGTGVFASVPENEINTLTAQISERERALDAREAELHEREIAAREFDTASRTDYSTYIISVILFIIIVLLVLNYAMDFTRNKRISYERQVA